MDSIAVVVRHLLIVASLVALIVAAHFQILLIFFVILVFVVLFLLLITPLLLHKGLDLILGHFQHPFYNIWSACDDVVDVVLANLVIQFLQHLLCRTIRKIKYCSKCSSWRALYSRMRNLCNCAVRPVWGSSERPLQPLTLVI